MAKETLAWDVPQRRFKNKVQFCKIKKGCTVGCNVHHGIRHDLQMSSDICLISYDLIFVMISMRTQFIWLNHV